MKLVSTLGAFNYILGHRWFKNFFTENVLCNDNKIEVNISEKKSWFKAFDKQANSIIKYKVLTKRQEYVILWIPYIFKAVSKCFQNQNLPWRMASKAEGFLLLRFDGFFLWLEVLRGIRRLVEFSIFGTVSEK